MSEQLPLRLASHDGASFENYLPGPNREAVFAMEALTTGNEQLLYLWGAPGTGKTHMLHAACNRMAHREISCAYVPLSQIHALSVAALQGLEHLALICIDDVQIIAANTEWEIALFHLFNRIRDCGVSLALAGRRPPRDLGILMPDLGSRLGWGLVLQLHELNDAQKLAALRARARARGFGLPEDVAAFILRHCSRDLPGLFALLHDLDTASLVAQRRLTIPFVREVLAASASALEGSVNAG